MLIINHPHDYRSNYQHLRGLIDMINDFPVWFKNANMIEIGTGTGDSTEIFSMFFDIVYSIDPMLDKVDGVNSKEVCREIFMRKIKGKNVEPIFDYSHIAIDSPKLPGGAEVVYIDGDHSYDFVKRDIELYWNKIPIGGFLSGHDYGCTVAGQDGVKPAVDELFGSPDRVYIDTSWVIEKTKERAERWKS